MQLHVHTPAFPLSHFIHYFWLMESYHPPHPYERILPVGGMELIFNLSDNPLRMYHPDDGYQPHCHTEPLVSGARSEFFLIDTAQPATILGVYFKFGGAQPFLGNSPAHELQNRHVPLAAFWRTQANDLQQRLLAALTPNERFSLLESALLSHYNPDQNPHRAITHALTLLDRVPTLPTIAHIVAQTGLGSTRLIQVFNQTLGMTPKRFSRIVRFQEALRHKAATPSHAWLDIALQCGYVDQAHMINEFQALGGITPSHYAPQDGVHRTNLPESNFSNLAAV